MQSRTVNYVGYLCQEDDEPYDLGEIIVIATPSRGVAPRVCEAMGVSNRIVSTTFSGLEAGAEVLTENAGVNWPSTHARMLGAPGRVLSAAESGATIWTNVSSGQSFDDAALHEGISFGVEFGITAGATAVGTMLFGPLGGFVLGAGTSYVLDRYKVGDRFANLFVSSAPGC